MKASLLLRLLRRRPVLLPPWALLAVPIVLSGCGFQPVYQKTSAVAGTNVPHQLSTVYVTRIADRAGQQLRNFLLDRFNPSGAPRKPYFELRTNVREARRSLALRSDAFATRVNLTVSADFDLVRRADGAVLFHGQSQITNGFNELRSDYATLSAERDARERALRAISDEIRDQVAVFLASALREQASTNGPGS